MYVGGGGGGGFGAGPSGKQVDTENQSFAATGFERCPGRNGKDLSEEITGGRKAESSEEEKISAAWPLATAGSEK